MNTTQKNRLHLVALFVAAFALALVALAPRPTAAAVRTISNFGGCVAEGTFDFVCLGVGGTDFQSGALSGAFFDYGTGQAMTVLLTLTKQSFSGTVASDTKSLAVGGGLVIRDTFVTAVNVKTNPSDFDYLFARLRNNSGGGVTGTTSISPLGIGYTK